MYYGLSDSKIGGKEKKGSKVCGSGGLIDYVGRTSISGQHFISDGNAFNLSSN